MTAEDLIVNGLGRGESGLVLLCDIGSKMFSETPPLTE